MKIDTSMCDCNPAAERGVSVYASEVLDCWYIYNGMVITGYRYNEDQTFLFFSIQNAFVILEACFLSFRINNQEYDRVRKLGKTSHNDSFLQIFFYVLIAHAL